MSEPYGKVTPEVLDSLRKLLGAENVQTDRDALVDYAHDEFVRAEDAHYPEVLVRPSETAQVSEIVKIARRTRIPVTPRGGGTGLCGGCVPLFGGILLSLEKMNRVREVDPDNLMAVCEAGVPLVDFYAAVNEAGLFFPPHPGDETATVGGVIATNAGGARAVKYGVIRNFVRGIEVVLPDGEIVELGGKIFKSSTGYSLLNLMIGSEGTLGIVTGATVSLLAPPAEMYTLVASYERLEDAVRTVPEIIRQKILPMAVEFVPRDAIEVTEAYLNKKWPLSEGRAYLMIIVDGSSSDEVLALSERVGRVCTDRGALNIVVADAPAKQRNILEIRSQIYEALRDHMTELLDVTVPRSRIHELVEASEDLGRRHGIWLPTYGHAADGNVHTHIMKARWDNGTWTETPGWREAYPVVRDGLHELGKSFGGVISGEHGIGFVKKGYMPGFLGERQMDLMKAVKRAFDPAGILNPGKVL